MVGLVDTVEELQQRCLALSQENMRLNKEVIRLRENEWLSAAIAKTPLHIYWLDQENNILGMGDELRNKFPNEIDMVGRNLQDFVEGIGGQDIVDELIKNNQGVFASGKEGKPFFFNEGSGYLGKQSMWLSCKQLVRRHSDGKLVLLGISMDITKGWFQLQSEIESKERSAAYLESIMDLLPGFIYWVNTEGIILGLNDMQAKHIGLEQASEGIGKHISYFNDFWGGDEITQALLESYDKVMSSGKIEVFEETIYYNEKNCVMLSHKQPLRDKNKKIIGVIGISFDYTTQKQVKEELHKAALLSEQANQLKTDLLSNLRHDFHTPISGIIGIAKLMKEMPEKEERTELLDNIIFSAENVITLFNSIIDYTDNQTGMLIKEEDVFKISKLFKRIEFDVEASLINKQHVKYTGVRDEKIPETLVGDYGKSYRVLSNLINNAIKYTNKGDVQLSAHLLSKTKQEVQILFIIEDTGVGIAKAMHKKIFQRFYRVESSYKSNKAGVGLGLNIVQELVESMGGSISMDSSIGKGSSFSVQLKFKQPSITRYSENS